MDKQELEKQELEKIAESVAGKICITPRTYSCRGRLNQTEKSKKECVVVEDKIKVNKIKSIKGLTPECALVTYLDGSTEKLNEDFNTIIILLENSIECFEIKYYTFEKVGVNFEITITNY